MWSNKKITFDSFIRGMLWVATFIIIFVLLNKLSAALLPFFIAWIIAYLLYPLVQFFQYKLHIRNRTLAIIATISTVIIVILGVVMFFVPPMIEEYDKVKYLIHTYLVNGGSHSSIPQSITEFIRENIDAEWFEKNFNTENIVKAVRGLLPKMWNIISTSYNVVLAIFTIFVIALYLFFILLDYEKIANGWSPLIPARYRNTVVRLVEDIKFSMNQYFRGQALVALCVGILFSIGFLIIDFPLAVGLGLFIGLLNMVPYLQIIGFIPTVLLALLKAADTGENFWLVLGLALLVFCVVQFIQDSFLVPKIMGKITGLNPAIILLSLSIWGSLMGMLGLIIALPCTTLLLSYYQRFIKREDLNFINEYQQQNEQPNTDNTSDEMVNTCVQKDRNIQKEVNVENGTGETGADN